MTFLLGIREIAGYQSRLSKGLRELGHSVTFIEIGSNPCNYPAEPGGRFSTWCNRLCSSLFNRRNDGIIHKIWWKVVTELLKPVVLVWSLWRHDHYLFVFGESFLPKNIDVPLLRALGRKVGFVFLGSDSRPPYLDYGGVIDKNGNRRSLKSLLALTRKTRKRVQRIDRWADFSIDNPASGHFHASPTFNWYQIGFPVDRVLGVPRSHGDSDGIIALHAPSHTGFKGTKKIQEAAGVLKGELPGFRMEQITDKANADVFKALYDCDFVVDQLYSDTPCAGFAIEAASTGRPAIVAGYGWSEAWLRVAGLGEFPSAVCHPGELLPMMRKMATDSGFREKVGAAAIRRAEQWRYNRVAERILRLFQGEGALDWVFTAQQVPSFYSGGGLEDSMVARVVYDLVCCHGWSSLQLDHCPQLYEDVAKFLKTHGHHELPAIPGTRCPRQ
jgi:hypothetical protein